MREGVENARVSAADIVCDRVLVDCISFEGEGWGQGLPSRVWFTKRGPGNLAAYLARLLEVLEVDAFSKLKGVPCRVRRDSSGFICGVGHYLKDQWFVPAEFEGDAK